MPNLKLISFGCQTNQLDSEKIAGVLCREGFRLTEQEEQADLIILNTCSIRQKAEEKFFSQLGRVGVLKKRKPLLGVGVCGCIAEQEGDGLKLRFPFVDFVVGPSQIAQIPSLLRKEGTTQEGEGPVIPLRFNRFKAWVEIMKGCDNFCAYCVVPYLRGREVSRPPEEILQEIEGLASSGYSEIVLLGHNVDSYGKGLSPPIDFAQLLRRIQERVSPSVWVRFTTSHPKDLTGEVGRCLAELPSLCKHVHLPVQSGSDRVLARMNRGYSSKDFFRIVDELRGWVPDIAISTDVMVGFPGETEEDFQRTLHLLEQVRFDRIFSFKYSPRPKTAALAYPGHLPGTIKAHRLNAVIILQNRITLERNQTMLGKVLEVRIENRESKRDANLVTARTQTNHIVHFADQEAEEGSLKRVRITRASPFHLQGEAIH